MTEENSDLPSPEELAEKVGKQVQETREEDIQSAIVIETESIMGQIRARIVEQGYCSEFPFVFALPHDKVETDAIWEVFWASGWYIDQRRGVITHVTSTSKESDAKLPTYYELQASIQDEIRASWDDVQKSQGEMLAYAAIAQLRKKILADGTQLDYFVKSEADLHWLVFNDLQKFLEGSGWFVYSKEPAELLQIKPWHGVERKTNLPCQSELEADAEAKLQSTEADAEAKVLAENLIGQVASQMEAGAGGYDYTVTVPDSSNWYVRKQATRLLDEAGWNVYLSEDMTETTLSKKGPRAFY